MARTRQVVTQKSSQPSDRLFIVAPRGETFFSALNENPLPPFLYNCYGCRDKRYVKGIDAGSWRVVLLRETRAIESCYLFEHLVICLNTVRALQKSVDVNATLRSFAAKK